MNRRTRWMTLGGVALVAVAGMAAPLYASDTATSYADGAFRKLGRGVANIVTCPLELIRTPELVGRKDGYVAAMSTGLAQGAWHTVVRGLAGVWDVVTFYAAIPEGFRPLVTPEFIYAHGDWAE